MKWREVKSSEVRAAGGILSAEHYLRGDSCVICGKWLPEKREHVDTCGERCYKKLLKIQRRRRWWERRW